MTAATHGMLESSGAMANASISSQNSRTKTSEESVIEDKNLESKRKRVDSDKSQGDQEKKINSEQKKQEKKKTKIDNENCEYK